MLNEKVKDLLNQQINKEFYSAYLYLAFSNYFADRNLDGFANWYQVQAQEERDHAMLFLQYVKNNSEKVTLEAIECPEQDFDKDMTVLEKGLQHERLKDCKYRIVQAITAFRLFLHSIPKGKKRDRRLFRRLPALRATVSW